ncbi:hypothetical protein V7S76_03100 [Aquirufa sp. ROCK2-A2]
MKRYLLTFLAVLLLAGSLSSCATVLGGPISSCQRTKPRPGKPSRAIRPVALVADIIIFWPFAVVDFATGAIYKPCD